ncbi:MAG TPA: hypothetical protein VKB34_08795 [Povalibacter sp.]|nr:hypothetical protein [Povalibacter sp.]
MSKLNHVTRVLLMLLFSATSRAADSFEAACQAMPAGPLVSVSTLPVVVDNTVAEGDMQSMTIRTTGAESLHELATVGTTVANRVWELSYGLAMITDGASGRVCYRPSIHVTLGYDPMRISVASPYHSGTCAYDMIVAHEREHVRIYSDFLPIAARAIELAAQAHISGHVHYTSSVIAANAEMSQLLRAQVLALIREEMAKGQALHNHFDSSEESVHLLNSCDGEVRRGLDREVLAWK